MSILTPNPNKAHSISEFIEAGREVLISYDSLSFIESMYDINFPVFNVFNDYIDDFKDLAPTLELTDKEFFKYKYKPKLLCQEIYGSTELYFILLMLNDMADVKEFCVRRFKAFTKTDLNTIISSVYNAEKKQIELYTGATSKDTES